MKRLSLEDLGEMMANGALGELSEHCPYCDKVSYPSEIDCKRVASEMAREGKGHSYAYECPKGRGWHLTSEKPKGGAITPKQRKPSRSHRQSKRQRQGFYIK